MCGMSRLRAIVRLVRPRQWIKNLLVISVPLAAGNATDVDIIRKSAIAFVAFLFASIAVYVANDIRDVEFDRRHSQKSFRPLATGEVSLGAAVVIGISSFAFTLATVLLFGNDQLLVVVGSYFLLQMLYQLGLKNFPLVEIFIVSAGFVLRAVAGGVAAEIPPTPWFLSVVGASSLFVVTTKRYSELLVHGLNNGTRPVLAQYSKSYLQLIWTVCLTCSIVFYSLWAVGVGEMNGARGVFSLISVIPFSIMLLRFAGFAERGAAETPEAIFLGDRFIQITAVIWICLYWTYSN